MPDTPPARPHLADLAYVVAALGASVGPAELPVTYALIRFHAGRAWVAPLGAPVPDGDGAHPSPAWIEIGV